MHELRLIFTATTADCFSARLTDAAGVELGIARDFAPFLDEKDYEDLRWYLEEYMDLPDGGAIVRAQGVEARLRRWGRGLYDPIFSPKENRALLDQLLASPEPRELSIATDVSALLRLPWELLEDEAGSLAQRLSVRRQLRKPEPVRAREVKLPLRMLYIVSRPADAGFIDPRLTTNAVFAALDPLGGSVRVDFCRPPTVANMEEMLRAGQRLNKPYDIVHFDGHGTYLPEAQIGALCFEKPDDGTGRSRTDLVPAETLGDLLAKYQVPLVVLEACRSGAMKTLVFRSIAPRLIQAGVGSVLSMGHAVHVAAATLLLDRFYRELVHGATIGHAVAEGRSALATTSGRWIESGPAGRSIALHDWFLPHLYQRGADDPLLPPDAAARRPAGQYDIFLSHNHNDSARVEGLARLLSEKHGLKVWLDKWKCVSGKLEPQCELGIRDSRFTVVAGSQSALDSKWVAWEIDKHNALFPEGDRLIPIKLEALALPRGLDELLWVDFTHRADDAANAALLAGLIRAADAEDARRRRGFRPPPERGKAGAFPPPPRYQFHGRARELYDLERGFRRHRGIVLHAMGGMGKTTLATEAAGWWTRSGLFADGACFLSFEQPVTAERAIGVLGAYLKGPAFDQLPAPDQRDEVIQLFREKAVLMVWDNYESVLPQFHEGTVDPTSTYTDDERRRLAELFGDLTAGAGRGCLLVTCRPGDTGLPGAGRMELQGLARPDSLWLLHRILGRDGHVFGNEQLTRDKLDPLLTDLADHPLSLELVGPHLRTLTPEAIRADFAKLLKMFQQDAPEGRNTSLLASLEFSRRHLSPAAREALPWLGLFSGGVFEDNFLDVSQIDPGAWEPIRAELQGIALLRVEDEIQIGDRPFLRFHPTLAIASADATLAAKPETRKRFIGVYYALMRALDKALGGSQSRAAMEILDREEANYRTAVRWAVEDRQYPAAAALGDTFSRYLQMSNRLRERDGWVTWLMKAVNLGGFTKESAAYEREHAYTLFTQGDPQGAVEKLRALVERLRQTKEFDPAFQLALAIGALGDMLNDCGASTQAIPFLREAIGHWEGLVKKESGKSSDELLAVKDAGQARTELGNLSVTMGDLANALCTVGQFDEALRVSENAVRIRETMRDDRNAAAGHGRSASILAASGRYDEADARYETALAAAVQAGDKELEGTMLQHQGGLALERNQLDRAARLYQKALQRFQEAGDQGAVMQTYNALGIVEQNAGRLAEARAWYLKSREMAEQLKDQPSLGSAAQNIGIICQMEGEAARERGDEPAALRHFDEARISVEESLRIKQAYSNKPDEALAWSQLARIHLRLNDLTAAERHANEARQIHESLGLKEAYKDYNTLSEIAQARGDTAAAAEWAQKRDTLRAELQRRAGGGGGVPAELLKPLQALAVECLRAGFGGGTLGPAAEENLATLDKYPAPLPSFAAFLRGLAAGRPPAIPASLPPELADFAGQLVAAVQSAAKT